MNNKHFILYKKNWWFLERLSLYKTLFLALFLGLLIFLIWQVIIEILTILVEKPIKHPLALK